MIIEYRLVVSVGPSTHDFDQRVTKHLEEGWRLQGGASVGIRTAKLEDGSGEVSLVVYCQAVVREKASEGDFE